MVQRRPKHKNPVREVSTSQLKARCSEIVEQVASRRDSIVVTRRGRAVARLVPIEEKGERRSLFGFARGSITVRGDLLEPIEVGWEAAGE
jgi:prevent-host-death family protein